MAGSSSASNIFFKGDGQPQPPANSQLNSSFGNSPSSISGTSRSNLVPGSLDTNRISNRAANSGPSVAASSLVTDANSALSGGGPHLQRSASINAESYLRVPASPMSYSSNNNISISGSSVMDGSCIAQQSSNQDQRQQQKGGSTFTSQTAQQAGQVSASLSQDTANLLQMQKRPRLDVRQEDILQQQVIQQLLRQDSMQLQGHNPHLQALIQQQRLVQRQQQQQQMLQSMPQIQRAHIQQQQQQQQQQQLRQQLQQQSVALPSKRSYDSGVCSRRLMQYIYHQRHRPSDNNILYWRKFVAEYFAPRAKKRWCLSLYDNVGHHTLGVFPQAAMDVWQCDICQSKTGRGFEATSEVLPRLNKIKFDSGVVDELLFVDMPHESRSPSGIMILEYGKAVQESVYEQLRVVREGRLRIIFNPDLKILSWEFCAQRHEELLPRRLIAPQVSQLVTAAQKCQTAAKESESAGFSPRDMQTNYNMFLTAGCQLAKNLESQSLNDLGFSKRYVRCLQISEVVSSMKDLIDFSREQRIGPIDSLKSYPRQVAAAKLQTQRMQEMEQLVNAQGLPTDQNALNKIMNIHPCLNSHMNTNQIGGVTNNAAQNAIALTNYRNLLRQHSMNSNPNTIQQDASCSSIGSDQSRSLPSQNPPVSPVGGSLQTTSISGLSTPHQQQHSVNANLQSDVIQQLLQEMMSSNGGVQPQQTLSGQNSNGNGTEDIFVGANGTGVRASISSTVGNGLGFGNNIKISNNVMGMIPGRGKSLAVSSNAINSRPELPSQDLHMPDLVQDISNEFAENAFDSEPGEMGFNWKA